MRKLTLFGCGNEANRIYYRLQRESITPELYFDNHRTGRFWGHNIESIRSYNEALKNCFFLITSDKYYFEIKEQLESMGLKEFDDFIKAGAYNKKIVYIHANCYAKQYYDCLSSNAEFSRRYYIYESRPIYDCENPPVSDRLLNNCNVYIHQDIRKENPYGEKYSYDYVKQKINRDCMDITVPNLVGMGKIYFPNAYENDDKNYDITQRWGFFPYGDVVIDLLYSEGKTVDEIYSILCTDNCFDTTSIINNLDAIFSKFKKRELLWDVKIVDYIYENFRKRRLFYDLFHPVNEIFERVAADVLGMLGIEDKSIKVGEAEDGFEIPIFPAVQNALGLEFCEQNRMIRACSDMKFRDMDLKEYIRQYVAWCYERHNIG